jgi:hypothetical protein
MLADYSSLILMNGNQLCWALFLWNIFFFKQWFITNHYMGSQSTNKFALFCHQITITSLVSESVSFSMTKEMINKMWFQNKFYESFYLRIAIFLSFQVKFVDNIYWQKYGLKLLMQMTNMRFISCFIVSNEPDIKQFFCQFCQHFRNV